MTELLRFPVLALSPSGVDVYETESDLVTCHRRSVQATYSGLKLIDSDRDQVQVIRFRAHPLPLRRIETGRMSRESVRVELSITEPARLNMNQVRAAIIDSLRSAEGDDFDEASELIGQLSDAKSMDEVQAAIKNLSLL